MQRQHGQISPKVPSVLLEYLRKEWSETEVEKFLKRVDKFINTIQKYREMCRSSLKRKNLRIGILDKHTQLIYYFKPGITR